MPATYRPRQALLRVDAYLNDDMRRRLFLVSLSAPSTTLRLSIARELGLGGPLMRLGAGLEVTLDTLLIRTEPYGQELPLRNWPVLLDDFRFLRGFDGMLGMD